MKKKFIAVLLCLTMLVPFAVLPASAEYQQQQTQTASSVQSAFADADGESLIVFVTGIGQSWSYLFDESYTQEGAFENGTLQDYENYAQLVADEKYVARWNLFNNYFDDALKEPKTYMAAINVVFDLLAGVFTRKNQVHSEDISALLENLFANNIIDENGKPNPRIVTPRYVMPVSEFPYSSKDSTFSEAKNRFYNCIPCKEVASEKLGTNFEDYLYVYNYSPFSYSSDNVEGLHDFVETIIANNKVGAEKVILVPMSMGASVVSGYLNDYPNVEDNHVRRVVSIVGCWNGSDVVADLLTQNYADNSADLFYNGLIAKMLGEPLGYVVNFILRFFSKQALRDFIDQALQCFCDVVFLRTPSLLVTVPNYAYEQIRPLIKENILPQTDKYQQVQSTVKERLEALEEQGVTFSFISAYGLPFGAITSDYTAFGFMNSAEKTNSDEIINIESTAPGTKSVAYNSVFEDEDGRILSPDKSIDISGTYYKDSTWFFRGQKHELEYNNNAIDLAINLALGNIKTIEDCDNLEEDGLYYPQFNGARNIKSLVRNYIPDLERYCAETGYVLTAEQQELYNEVIAMKNCKVNNYEEDNLLMAEFNNMLVEIGVYNAPAEAGKLSQLITKVLKKGNDLVYKVVGPKGFIN